MGITGALWNSLKAKVAECATPDICLKYFLLKGSLDVFFI